jgi:hypothetical protein
MRDQRVNPSRSLPSPPIATPRSCFPSPALLLCCLVGAHPCEPLAIFLVARR